jgi:endonuclease YncB( thermonuclease family)
MSTNMTTAGLATVLALVKLWFPIGAGAVAPPAPREPAGGWIEFKGHGWAEEGVFHVAAGKALDTTAVVETLKANPLGAMSMLEGKMGSLSIGASEVARYRTYLANVLVDAGLSPGTAAMYLSEGLGPNTARMLVGHVGLAAGGTGVEHAGGLEERERLWNAVPLVDMGEAMRRYLLERWPSRANGTASLPSPEGGGGGWIEFKGSGWTEPDARLQVRKGAPPNIKAVTQAVRERPFFAMSWLELRMAQIGLSPAVKAGHRANLATILTDIGFNPGAAAMYAQEGLSPNVARVLFSLYSGDAGPRAQGSRTAPSAAAAHRTSDWENGPFGHASCQLCMANLELIGRAKQVWAAANGKSDGDTLDWDGPTGVTKYLPGREEALPCCPSQGVYTMNSVGVPPACSVHGAGTPLSPLPVVRFPCKVLEVIDGDTIVVEWRGRTEHVRLLRVNAPERGQPGFHEAKALLERLTKDMTVALEFERPGERDRYARLLCYVFAEGSHVNLEVVRAGCSPFWTKYGDGRYALAFRLAEMEARAKRAGLWGNPSTLRTDGLPRP